MSADNGVYILEVTGENPHWRVCESGGYDSSPHSPYWKKETLMRFDNSQVEVFEDCDKALDHAFKIVDSLMVCENGVQFCGKLDHSEFRVKYKPKLVS